MEYPNPGFPPYNQPIYQNVDQGFQPQFAQPDFNQPPPQFNQPIPDQGYSPEQPPYQYPTNQPPQAQYPPYYQQSQPPVKGVSKINWPVIIIVGVAVLLVAGLIILLVTLIVNQSKSSSGSGSSSASTSGSSSGNLPIFDGNAGYFIIQNSSGQCIQPTSVPPYETVRTTTPVVGQNFTLQEFKPIIQSNGRVVIFHNTQDTALTDTSGFSTTNPVSLSQPQPNFNLQEWIILEIPGSSPQAFQVISPDNDEGLTTSTSTPGLLIFGTQNVSDQSQWWVFQPFS